MRHTPPEWHGVIPARECDPNARAELLEAELPGIVALRNSGRWPFLLTDDQAARAAEDAVDPFFYIDEQIKREERVRDEQEEQW